MKRQRSTVLANRERIEKMTFLAIMTALVVLLQALSMVLGRFGIFTITFALVPIVLGAAVNGIGGGMWLGAVFGAMTLFDSALFMSVSIPATVLVCLAKGILAGLSASVVYKLLSTKNTTLAVVAAAFVTPIVNTGVFLIGCILFFIPELTNLMGKAGFDNVYTFMILGLVGVNFIVELIYDLILSPGVLTLINIKKTRNNK